MSFDELLIDDLQLWHDVAGDADGFNQPTYTPELVDVVRGRIFALSTFEQRFAMDATRAVVKRYRAALEYRTDVDERSTIIDDASGVYDVIEVNVARDAVGPHHLELQLEKASP